MAKPMDLRPRLWVAVFGVAGLIGFLLLARAMPHDATPLRLAAFAWFLAFGAYDALWRARDRRKAGIETRTEESRRR